jgi:hypothetical protein
MTDAHVRRLAPVRQSVNAEVGRLPRLVLFGKHGLSITSHWVPTMPMLAAVALAASLVLSPLVALAHGDPPQAAHGGQMQEAHENWVELVVSGTQVTLYVLDEGRKPVPASQVSGTASVLVEGKIYKVQLARAPITAWMASCRFRHRGHPRPPSS